jgi:hypothetical protein
MASLSTDIFLQTITWAAFIKGRSLQLTELMFRRMLESPTREKQRLTVDITPELKTRLERRRQ